MYSRFVRYLLACAHTALQHMRYACLYARGNKRVPSYRLCVVRTAGAAALRCALYARHFCVRRGFTWVNKPALDTVATPRLPHFGALSSARALMPGWISSGFASRRLDSRDSRGRLHVLFFRAAVFFKKKKKKREGQKDKDAVGAVVACILPASLLASLYDRCHYNTDCLYC